MPDSLDLASYFQRINYDGPAAPNLAALHALVRHHMAHIPFEAIDVLLDRGIRLESEQLQEKLIHRRRGGYCFEHTGLFRLVLEQLGFSVRQHLARVWLNRDPETDPAGPATHTSLSVQIEGKTWLVDVGFGSFMPTEPIPWDTNTPFETKWGTYDLVESQNGLLLRSLYQQQWQPLYEILDLNWQPIDYQVANHYVSTHPNSHFRQDLNVALTTATERRTLAGNLFRRRYPDGRVVEQRLDAQELKETLEEEFGLQAGPDWDLMLQSAAEN